LKYKSLSLWPFHVTLFFIANRQSKRLLIKQPLLQQEHTILLKLPHFRRHFPPSASKRIEISYHRERAIPFTLYLFLFPINVTFSNMGPRRPNPANNIMHKLQLSNFEWLEIAWLAIRSYPPGYCLRLPSDPYYWHSLNAYRIPRPRGEPAAFMMIWYNNLSER
jgi:hypothetical protein